MTATDLEPAGTGAFDPNDPDLVRSLGLDPSRPTDRAMVSVARHYGLDPLLRHVVVLPKGGVYVTRDGMLAVAHRSGQLDGITVDAGPTFDTEAGEWRAVVSVWRKDHSKPYTFPGRYPSGKGNKEYAQEMALKSAEAAALRRAFPLTPDAGPRPVDRLPAVHLAAVELDDDPDAAADDAWTHGLDDVDDVTTDTTS